MDEICQSRPGLCTAARDPQGKVSGKAAAPNRRGVASLQPPPDVIDPDLDPGSDPDQSRGSWLWEPRYRFRVTRKLWAMAPDLTTSI